MRRLTYSLLLIAASVAACKTVDRNGTTGDIKTLSPVAFDLTVQGTDSSSFAARLYRALETSQTSMQDAGVPIPVRSGSALSVAWHGDFVSCDVAGKTSIAKHSCRIATASPELSWTSEDESIQAILYRALILRQGGLGALSLVGGDASRVDCDRRRSFGQTEYRCAFNIISQQDLQ